MAKLVETLGGTLRLVEYNHVHDTKGRFSSGAGGVGLATNLAAIEDRIVQRQDGEDIYVLDSDGNVVASQTGDMGNANGTEGAVASTSLPANFDYTGTTVTHNHPLMGDTVDEVRKYDSFSPDDIRSAMGMNVAEARMVNLASTQTLRPGPNGWGDPMKLDSVARQVVGDGSKYLTPEHYVLRQALTADLAKAMGWEYKVVPRG